jgi:hypothetical protein
LKCGSVLRFVGCLLSSGDLVFAQPNSSRCFLGNRAEEK